MPSRVPGTFRGAGITPACPKCDSNEHVIRMWIGRKKVWICDACYKVTSTAKKEQSLKQRLFHQHPEPDTMRLSEIYPNRRARRGR